MNRKFGGKWKYGENKEKNKAKRLLWTLLIVAFTKCANIPPVIPDTYFEQFPDIYQLSSKQWKMELKFINQLLNDSISYYDPYLEREVNIVYRLGKLVYSSQDESEDRCQAESGRGTEAILKVIRKESRTNIRKVYTTFMQKYPNLEGRISIKILIDKSGSIAFIFPVEDETQNPKFTNAIVSEIQNWMFVKTNCEKYEYVTIPLTFTP